MALEDALRFRPLLVKPLALLILWLSSSPIVCPFETDVPKIFIVPPEAVVTVIG